MQRRLWLQRDAAGDTAAHLALDAAAWGCLRVLASCKAADLKARRRAHGGALLAEELRSTPVAEQAAVQAVLSQLAYAELLQGLDGAHLSVVCSGGVKEQDWQLGWRCTACQQSWLVRCFSASSLACRVACTQAHRLFRLRRCLWTANLLCADEESQSKAKAAKAAKKKAKKQGKAGACHPTAPAGSSSHVRPFAEAEDGHGTAQAALPESARAASSSGQCDAASHESVSAAAAKQPGNAFSMLSDVAEPPSDAWKDVPARRISKDKPRTAAAAASAAPAKKQVSKKGGTAEAKQGSAAQPHVHTHGGASQTGRASRSSVDGSSKRSNSGIGAAPKRSGKEGPGKRSGTTARQGTGSTAAAAQVPAAAPPPPPAKEAAPAAAGERGSTLLKNSVWGDRPVAHALHQTGANPAAGTATLAADCIQSSTSMAPAPWSAHAQLHSAAAAGLAADVWAASIMPAAPVHGHGFPALERPSLDGSQSQRQASVTSSDWPAVDAASAFAAATPDGSGVWAAPAPLATPEARPVAEPLWPSHDAPIGRHSLDAAHAHAPDSARADSTPIAMPAAQQARQADGWSPLTSADQYGEWRDMGGSPQLDSILRHALDGDEASPDGGDAIAAGLQTARAPEAMVPVDTNTDAIVDRRHTPAPDHVQALAPAQAQQAGGAWMPWHHGASTSSSQGQHAAQHGLWAGFGAGATLPAELQQQHHQRQQQQEQHGSFSESAQAECEQEPEWALPLNGSPLPLGTLHHGTFVAQ